MITIFNFTVIWFLCGIVGAHIDYKRSHPISPLFAIFGIANLFFSLLYYD